MSGGASERTGGFILVETIVAFAILSLALGVAMQTISQSARTIVRAGEIQTASLAWDALLAKEIGPLRAEGELEGELDGGVRWQASARAVRDSHSRPLLAVTARIWPRGAGGPSFVYRTFVSNPVGEVP